MSFSLKNLLFFVLIASFIFPLTVQASGTYQIKIDGQTSEVCYEGMVPCGKCVKINGNLNEQGRCEGGTDQFIPCHLCHIFILIHDGVNFFLFYIVLPVAILMLVIGGIIYLTQGDNPQWIARANDIFYNTFLGLVIIFGAFILVGTFLSLIGVADWVGLGTNQWFVINCEMNFNSSDLAGIGVSCP